MTAVQLLSYQTGMEARFAAAARHSRLVRTLLVAVPVVGGLSMAVIIAISLFNPFRYLSKLPPDVGDLIVSSSKISMESPHLAGFTNKGRPFEMWARTAIQGLTNQDHVDLHTLRAKVQSEDQSTVIIESREGQFETKAQLLKLNKDVYLHDSKGTEAWMTQADIDLDKGTITSDSPVDVKWEGGMLRGQRMRITEKGDLIRFEGGVMMNLDNNSLGEPAPAAQAVPRPVQIKDQARPNSGQRGLVR